jgi:hypothetical protein
MEKESIQRKIMELREVMKGYSQLSEDIISDQSAGLPQPLLEKQSIGSKFIPLTKSFDHMIKNNNFLDVLNRRTSRRVYTEEALTKDELAFLLWATQGVKEVVGKGRKATLRTVPSAGARHPFETYLFINRVEGLNPGLYHYLAIEHKLEFIKTIDGKPDRVSSQKARPLHAGGSSGRHRQDECHPWAIRG